VFTSFGHDQAINRSALVSVLALPSSLVVYSPTKNMKNTRKRYVSSIVNEIMQLIPVKGKARDWARNNWIDEARARTDALRRQGRQGPTVWVLTHGKSIPSGAIVTGQERGRNLYSSRTFHEVCPFQFDASISYLSFECRVLSVSSLFTTD
jgi:hypothetical protein